MRQIDKLEEFKKYGININLEIIVWGFENNFVSLNCLIEFFYYKLEQEGNFAEKEMNLFLNLMNNELNGIEIIRAIKNLPSFNPKQTEEVLRDIFLFIFLSNAKTNHKKLEDLMIKLETIQIAFDYPSEFHYGGLNYIISICGYEDLSKWEKGYYQSNYQTAITTINEILNNFSKKYKGFLIIKPNKE